ncbi:membrane protein insertase YidC [Clostridioides difficile]|nr:membrane protein insertase YidC [Clostridioides difficile]
MDFISSILQGLLSILFNFTGDFGISIVLITLIVKLVLMPLSLKQRFSVKKQQELAEKMEHIKEKYKNDTKELEKQIQVSSVESMKSMLGCLIVLVQMPVVYALYHVCLDMTKEFTTIIIPWIANLGTFDNLFILPCIYTLIMLASNLVNYIPYLKINSQVKFNKQMAVVTTITSLILTVITPVAIGLYFITSAIYSLIEDICFRMYFNRKNRIVTK